MRIFDWNSWGNITTYKAETLEELEAIYSLMKNSLDGFGCEDIIEKSDNLPITFRNKSGAADIAVVKKIECLINEFGIDTHELIQHGTGFSALTDPIAELNSDE